MLVFLNFSIHGCLLATLCLLGWETAFTACLSRHIGAIPPRSPSCHEAVTISGWPFGMGLDIQDKQDSLGKLVLSAPGCQIIFGLGCTFQFPRMLFWGLRMLIFIKIPGCISKQIMLLLSILASWDAFWQPCVC